VHTEQSDFWPARAGTRARIPELDTLNDAPLARKINDLCLAASRDHVTNVNRLRTAVSVVDNDPVKFNWGSLDAEDNCPVRAARSGDPDVIVICPAIDIRLAEVLPAALPLRVDRRTDTAD